MRVGYALDLVADVHSSSVTQLLEALVCCFKHGAAQVAQSQTAMSAGAHLLAPGTLRCLILHCVYKPHHGSCSAVLTHCFVPSAIISLPAVDDCVHFWLGHVAGLCPVVH